MVRISLEAKGQALTVTQAPPVLASGVVDLMRFDVKMSQEWDGFENYALLLKNGETVRSCAVENGQACADREAIAGAGMLEAALIAYGGGDRLTTERVIIRLLDSGV
jgi:hypothetical protein